MSKRAWVVGFIVALAAFLFAPIERPVASAQRPMISPTVGSPVFPKVFTGDLHSLVTLQAGPSSPHVIPLRTVTQPRSFIESADPVLESAAAPSRMPASTTFAGLSMTTACQGGPCGDAWPPDPNGDVGPDYYVQAVNTSFGIFSKNTGNLELGIKINQFWAGAGGTNTLCDNANYGDPIVVYDAQADRWLVSDFAFVIDGYSASGPFYECIAVSRSGDPIAGGWYYYPILFSNTVMNDYPKFGVWSDGYYMTANLFEGYTYLGARIWALDRAKMIAGEPVAPVAFDVGPSYGSLLPANFRGAPPPAGSPAYLLSIDSPSTNTLHLWRLHFDVTTPGASVLDSPIDIPVAPFAEPCVYGGGGSNPSCIPQKNSRELVDALGDRLMMQAQYRNLGGQETLWATHTVKVATSDGWTTGIRWYELRDPNGTPTVRQQSTYRPDNKYRWLPSLAVDSQGNMAIGYSVSSASVFPSIRYAGRLATDPLNKLAQGEATMTQGTGSQIGGSARWGDYSAMTVDPVDDCTFWYTNEYFTETGPKWRTRIGSFKFPSCASSPTSKTVQENDHAIDYDGWQAFTNANAANGWVRASTTPGETAVLRFTGGSVKWIYSMGPDGGIARVTVDGGKGEVVDLYSPTAVDEATIEFKGLGNTAHKLTIQVLDSANPDSSGHRVVVDAFQVGSATIEDDSPKIRYDGWISANDDAASGDAFRYSETAGDTATFHFGGENVDWITLNGPRYGRAEVWIDGQLKTTVDLYAARVVRKVRIPFHNLGPGEHTLQIKVLGTKSRASSGYRVAVDAFAVTP